MRKQKAAKPSSPVKPTARQPRRGALPSVGPGEDGSRDTMLLIGGLALLALVVCDTAFLTLSTRALRSAR